MRNIEFMGLLVIRQYLRLYEMVDIIIRFWGLYIISIRKERR